jgi:hypothetical protein
LECRAGDDLSARAGALWRIVWADKVPDGAVTAPLGDPSGGEVADAPAAVAPVESAATPGASATGTDAAVAVPLTVGMNEMFLEPARIEIPTDTDVPITLEAELHLAADPQPR